MRGGLDEIILPLTTFTQCLAHKNIISTAVNLYEHTAHNKQHLLLQFKLHSEQSTLN